jgi:predicted PurR-regulated permease PerM
MDRKPVVRVHSLVTVAVAIVALWLFLHFFSAGKILLLGLLAAGTVAATLRPVAERIPGARWVGALVAGIGFTLLAAAVLVLLSWFLADAIRGQLADWPHLRDQLNGVLARWSERFGLGEPVTVRGLGADTMRFLAGGNIEQAVSQATTVATSVGIALAFAFIGSIYLLTERSDRLLRPVERLFPPARRPALARAVEALEPRLRWWFLGTIASMVLVGLASWAGYAVIGLRFALPLALVAGALEIVPTIGPLLTFAVALLVAATQGTTQLLGVVVVYSVVQVVESYLILPLVMERAVRIPPIVTLATVILWGNVFGPAGLLLALPLDLLVWTVLETFVAHRDDERAREVSTRLRVAG